VTICTAQRVGEYVRKERGERREERGERRVYHHDHHQAPHHTYVAPTRVHQRKHLREVERLALAVRQKLAGHKDQQPARVGRLRVQTDDTVLNALERQTRQLLDDRLCALELLSLEGQHGRILVQTRQRRPIRVERLVVVVRKGLADCHRICHAAVLVVLRYSPTGRPLANSKSLRVFPRFVLDSSSIRRWEARRRVRGYGRPGTGGRIQRRSERERNGLEMGPVQSISWPAPGSRRTTSRCGRRWTPG